MNDQRKPSSLNHESSFGVQLRHARERAGLTQEELAERAGLSANAISALERGERKHPYPATVRALAAALGLTEIERAELATAVPARPAPATHVAPRLPSPRLPFIGREREVDAVIDLLTGDQTQLLTITGPGGVGKTRLAIEVASRLFGQFADGAWFIGLASLRDAALVPAAIARVLGVGESSAESIENRLAKHLRTRQLLLVADNIEQLLDAGPFLASLVAAAPRMRILATSRVRLRLSNERVYELSPFALPDERLTTTELAETESVRFFIACASAAHPGFVLDDASADPVGAICRQLDGLPLAIELAAARIGDLSPVALQRRLERRLPLLTNGPRDLPPHQQTVRDTIAWSCDLLPTDVQHLFRRLAVFSGGFTLDAAESVAGEPGFDTFEGITILRENGLLRRYETRDGDVRFTMLETIREFAAEMLEASGEAAAIRRRHADWCLTLGEGETASQRDGPEMIHWLHLIDAEHPNIRGALDWLDRTGDGVGMITLASSVSKYWYEYSCHAEGINWLDRVHRYDHPGLDLDLRLRLHISLAVLLDRHGVHERSRQELEERLVLARALGDDLEIGRAHHSIGVHLINQCSYDEGVASIEQAMAIHQRLGVETRVNLGAYLLAVADYGRDDYATAIERLQPVIAQRRRDGEVIGVAVALDLLALLMCETGQSCAAAAALSDALASWSVINNLEVQAEWLAAVARRALALGADEQAARLYGASDALSERTGSPLVVPPRMQHQRHLSELRKQMGDAAFDAAWAAGREIEPDEAIALATELLQSDCVRDDATTDSMSRL